MQEFWSLSIRYWRVLDKMLPFLVLIVAICAIYIAIQSKREARIATQVNLFYQLMARYSSPEMGKALNILLELFDTRRQNEAAFLSVVKKYHNKDLSLSTLWQRYENITEIIVTKIGEPVELFRHNYEETNQARLQVSSFFTFSFYLFKDFTVLDDVYFKKICSVDSFKYLYHVIEWLELAFNPDYNRKTFTELLEQSGREDIKDLKEQRPPGIWTLIEQMMEARQGRE